MADVITSYLDTQPKATAGKNDKTCDVYPCILTNKTWNKLWDGCEQSRYDNSCDDCCWMCLPCSLAIDTITFFPFLVIYGCNQHRHKSS